MARSKKAEATVEKEQTVKLPEIKMRGFRIWIVGDTPLITHAWSEKAKRQMLNKQLKNVSEGRPTRDPESDFVNSLYEFDDEGHYGFPAMAVKKAMLSAAHKDKGVPRETVRGALWLHAQMIRTRPALAGAICDMPLLRIYGSEPEMREDMVKVGVGLSKTADLAYRGQFSTWALKVAGRLNVSVCPLDWLPFLIRHSGLSTGIGDWRNEKNGMFGAYHLASPAEAAEWDLYAEGKGELPTPIPFGDDEDASLEKEAA
jgi:hypothetical protein